MRAGDRLLIGLIAASLAGVVADGATGGAVQSWIQANLASYGGTAGEALGWLGLALSPFALIPLAAALWGRIAGLPDGAARLLTRAARAIDKISVTIADLARWFALGLVLVTVFVVVQRYVFGASSTKLQESVIYMHAGLFLLSSGAALLSGAHVRVDILFTKLGERGRAWTDLLGTYLALLPMCWLILQTSQSYVGGAWRILERSRESDGLPLVFLLKTAIPVFAVLMILQGLAMAARAALVLSDRPAPPAGATTEHEL
ncbi:permease [Marinicauda salina]|uniref:TRAP transporter small permease protein n=1 Tax=Marinicauda salina TaxID=2135793 RepID=A0A2U2BVC7_9PROT|nr:TRAP transporter small permease subunit [Marinicauda salina]PWE17968.1 permease [Marinicauda salina]